MTEQQIMNPEIKRAIDVLSLRLGDVINQTNMVVNMLVNENNRLTKELCSFKSPKTSDNPTECEVKKHAY